MIATHIFRILCKYYGYGGILLKSIIYQLFLFERKVNKFINGRDVFFWRQFSSEPFWSIWSWSWRCGFPGKGRSVKCRSPSLSQPFCFRSLHPFRWPTPPFPFCTQSFPSSPSFPRRSFFPFWQPNGRSPKSFWTESQASSSKEGFCKKIGRAHVWTPVT